MPSLWWCARSAMRLPWVGLCSKGGALLGEGGGPTKVSFGGQGGKFHGRPNYLGQHSTRGCQTPVPAAAAGSRELTTTHCAVVLCNPALPGRGQPYRCTIDLPSVDTMTPPLKHKPQWSGGGTQPRCLTMCYASMQSMAMWRRPSSKNSPRLSQRRPLFCCSAGTT